MKQSEEKEGSNEMELVNEKQAIRYYGSSNELLAEITYQPKEGTSTVIADHTYVHPSLRGQGIAERLLDALVKRMEAEGKKIEPICSYVVNKFEAHPEKYQHINSKPN